MSQDLLLECEFFDTWTDEYACLLENIEALNEIQNIIITGNHLEGRTNEDVEVVAILDSNTPFMIQQIFSTFPNIQELEIGNSGLQSINVSMSVQLQILDLYLNNITRIANGSFLGQRSLLVAYLDNNNIQTIDEDAFEEIVSLLTMSMNRNRLHTIHPRTFHAISDVRTISLQHNNLSSVGEALFSRNEFLTALHLDSNVINEISPRFADNLREHLAFIDMTGNVCANDVFRFQTPHDWDSTLFRLRNCFNNFEGLPEPSRINMEFTGPLKIFDGSGNWLATV